jgi:hypothetical protein
MKYAARGIAHATCARRARLIMTLTRARQARLPSPWQGPWQGEGSCKAPLVSRPGGGGNPQARFQSLIPRQVSSTLWSEGQVSGLKHPRSARHESVLTGIPSGPNGRCVTRQL